MKLNRVLGYDRCLPLGAQGVEWVSSRKLSDFLKICKIIVALSLQCVCNNICKVIKRLTNSLEKGGVKVEDIIKTLAIVFVLRLPALTKQLRLWHLGYLDRKPNNKDK